MKLRDMISMALGNLFKRKARTILTVSGVVIGTCAIVVMISFGIGVQQSWEESMKNFGDLTAIEIHNYAMMGGSDMDGGSVAMSGSSKQSQPLDDAALKKIEDIPNVVAVTPSFYLSGVTVSSGKYQFRGEIFGVNMQALEKLGYKLEKGVFPQKEMKKTDILLGSKTAYEFYDGHKKMPKMISPRPDKNGKLPKPYVDLMKDKFELCITPNEDPDAKGGTGVSAVKSKPYKLNVLGVLKNDNSKQPSPRSGVFMDVAFAKELKKQSDKLNKVKNDKDTGYDEAYVKVSSIEKVEEVEKSIKNMGFETYSMSSERNSAQEQTRKIQMILGGLGAISLLVAALGITNTMIMSIYERTREIGIMKVLGCVIRNIRTMFLVEAGAIGFIGGIVGVGLSYGISYIINSLAAGSVNNMTGGMGSNISIIPFWLAGGALIFATMVGLLSGLHPANRAMKISALTAIKQE